MNGSRQQPTVWTRNKKAIILIFQSNNKSLPVKGVVISASNSSGKTHLLRTFSANYSFKDVHIFEMDSLKYYDADKLKTQTPVAWDNFTKWLQTLDNNPLLEELLDNIRSSKAHAQLIKLKVVHMMSCADQFITILPSAIRYNANNVRFLQILEEHFGMRIVHIAITTSITRHFVNLIKRRKLFKFTYVSSSLKERKRIINNAPHFDHVINISLDGHIDNETIDIFKEYLIY